MCILNDFINLTSLFASKFLIWAQISYTTTLYKVKEKNKYKKAKELSLSTSNSPKFPA
jgi:hypothetical protein